MAANYIHLAQRKYTTRSNIVSLWYLCGNACIFRCQSINLCKARHLLLCGEPYLSGACSKLCKCPYSSELRTTTSGMTLPCMRITAVQPSKTHCLKRRTSEQPSSPHPYHKQWRKEANRRLWKCALCACKKTGTSRLRSNAANSRLKRAGCKLSGTEPPQHAKSSMLSLIAIGT